MTMAIPKGFYEKLHDMSGTNATNADIIQLASILLQANGIYMAFHFDGNDFLVNDCTPEELGDLSFMDVGGDQLLDHLASRAADVFDEYYVSDDAYADCLDDAVETAGVDWALRRQIHEWTGGVPGDADWPDLECKAREAQRLAANDPRINARERFLETSGLALAMTGGHA